MRSAAFHPPNPLHIKNTGLSCNNSVEVRIDKHIKGVLFIIINPNLNDSTQLTAGTLEIS